MLSVDCSRVTRRRCRAVNQAPGFQRGQGKPRERKDKKRIGDGYELHPCRAPERAQVCSSALHSSKKSRAALQLSVLTRRTVVFHHVYNLTMPGDYCTPSSGKVILFDCRIACPCSKTALAFCKTSTAFCPGQG